MIVDSLWVCQSWPTLGNILKPLGGSVISCETLTCYHVITALCKQFSKQLPLYTPSRYRATSAFIWSRECPCVQFLFFLSRDQDFIISLSRFLMVTGSFLSLSREHKRQFSLDGIILHKKTTFVFSRSQDNYEELENNCLVHLITQPGQSSPEMTRIDLNAMQFLPV